MCQLPLADESVACPLKVCTFTRLFAMRSQFRLHLPRRRARRGRCLLRERRVAALAGAARQFLVSKSADRDDEHDDDADEDGLRGVPFGRRCLRRICFLRWRRRR